MDNGKLPSLRNVSPEQVKLTVGTAIATGVFDIAVHNPAVALGSLVFLGGVGYLSSDLIEMLALKKEQVAVVNAAQSVADHLAPEEEDPYKDQSAKAKILRLLGRQTPPLEYAPGEPVVTAPAQPKDDLVQRRETAFLDDEDEEDTELLPPSVKKPVPTLFSSVISEFTPSLNRIYLASTPEGESIFCTAEDLCHVALAGSTNGGKSSIMRLLMAQLCKAGAQVLLLNPHYTRYDLKRDEDWTPFTPYLLHDPMECRDYGVIEHYLKQAATVLLPKRLERYAHSQPIGKPYFIVLDELPAIVKQNPNTPGYLGLLLEQGRKVGIFLISAAQGFLISQIGGDSTVRDCYRTAYYVGGDATTAKTLLDMPAKLIPEDQLGRGTIMFRCAAVPATKKAQLDHVPYCDNVALYRLLGPSTYQKEALPFVDDEPDVLLRPEPARQSSMPVQRLQPRPSSMTPLPMREQPQRERIDMRGAIQNMRAAGYEERDIMRLVGMSQSEYRRVVADMDGVQAGGSREVPDDDGYTHSEHNLTVFPGRRNLPTEPPNMDTDEPVESAECTSEEFQPGPNDLLLSEVQAEVLIAYYRKCNNVEKSLAQIRNEKGQGLGGRYTRHASYILEQRGLKKIKRA